MRRIDKDERVGSNSWPSSEFHDHDGSEVSNCPFPSPSPPQQQQQQQRRRNNKDDDACFACQQKGHWAKDCPNNKKNKNTTTTVTATTTSTTNTNTGDDADYQDGPTVDLMCPCGAGCCNILTSKTARNPNRIFYRCPLYRPKACRFFMWCDELFLITGPPPPCPCGAGLCCVGIQNHHQQNRKHPSPSYLFVCPIKKGQGACNFIQPVVAATYSKGKASMSSISSSPKSPLTHCFSDDTATRPSPSSSITISDMIKVEDESSDISFQESESKLSVSGTPKQPPVQLETSCRVPWDDEMRMLMNFQELKEDIPGEKKKKKKWENLLFVIIINTCKMVIPKMMMFFLMTRILIIIVAYLLLT